MTNKDIALSYLQKGLSIIPLWSRAQILKKPPPYFVNELNRKLDENRESEDPISENEIYENYLTRVCKRAMVTMERIPNPPSNRRGSDHLVLKMAGCQHRYRYRQNFQSGCI